MSTRSRTPGRVVSCAAALAIISTSCSVGTDGSPHDIIGSPGSIGSTTTVTTTSVATTEQPRIFFVVGVDAAPRLLGVERSDVSSIESALDALIAGPTAAERSERLASAIPPGVTIDSTAPDVDGTVVLDANRALLDADEARLTTALAQIVLTLTSHSEVRRVRILVEGAAHLWMLPGGDSTADALSPRDFEATNPASPAAPVTTTGG